MNEIDNRSLESDRIKGVLFRWTDESARWYEEASRHTGYHNRLEEIIAPHLEESWRCCELACGTGTLARHLAPHVSAYTANDLDPHAMEHLRRMNAKDPIPGFEVLEGDWHQVLEGRAFDAAIISFFGAILTDWDRLSSMIRKKVIAVIPRSKEGRMKVAALAASEQTENITDADRPDKPQRIIRGKQRSFETSSDITQFLDEKGVSYLCEDYDLEFGQPFHNLSEARDYVRYYYKLEEDQIDFFLEKKLERTETGWYFPKKKEISVIVADLTAAQPSVTSGHPKP